VNAEVFQLAQAASEPPADFAQRLSLRQLTEQHGYELIPAGEAFAVFFSLMFTDDVRKLTTGENSQNLAEHTCGLNHDLLQKGVVKVLFAT